MNRWIALSFCITLASGSYADPPVTPKADLHRVLEIGEQPGDLRFEKLKTLNDHFPFVVPENSGAWFLRAEFLRRRVLVATGLWPMPEKPPLHSVVFDKTQRDGFTVEKVYFQSLPGHYVTGLLFRPSKPRFDRAPGVLCPHGHGGRMQSHSDEAIARQIQPGGEHFENSGRTPKLARCAQLARMGCVSFIFDMVGYADSIQISHQVSHRHAKARPEEKQRGDDWVFFSIDADLRNQSIMGLQTWNAIRALDFLASLPDVDPDRLAVTGGSGGGTQSILLGAIDERVKASFPNGMVSTAMQGGCYCENCNLLRIDTGNVELAALFAPRPQAMTSADDWTRDMMTDGYPELKWLYAMIGDQANVYCRPMLEFKHNYNYIARATMYQWMNRHLNLGLDDPVIEQDFAPLTDQETTVWDEEHPSPSVVGIPHERAVCRWFDQQASAQLEGLEPADAESLKTFRATVGGAWQIIFDQGVPKKTTYKSRGKLTSNGITVERGMLHDATRGANVPVLTVSTEQATAEKITVWTHANGKQAAFRSNGAPTDQLEKLLRHGVTVLLPDLFQQGELSTEKNDGEQQRVIDDPRSYSAFTFGYNRTLAAHRTADLLAVIAHARQQGGKLVTLLGTSGTAAWVAPAAAHAGSLVDRALIQSDDFRFANVNHYRDADFVPGAVKYGDLPAILALRSPYPLAVVGDTNLPAIVSKAFTAAGKSDSFQAFDSADITAAEIDWLVGNLSP
ncbi:MAG: alpha/beta hydrolase family protein [Planctomycetota bacterium]|nr:alpha/beta hydrolase family protein [Planctomycetota bacterium]